MLFWTLTFRSVATNFQFLKRSLTVMIIISYHFYIMYFFFLLLSYGQYFHLIFRRYNIAVIKMCWSNQWIIVDTNCIVIFAKHFVRKNHSHSHSIIQYDNLHIITFEFGNNEERYFSCHCHMWIWIFHSINWILTFWLRYML